MKNKNSRTKKKQSPIGTIFISISIFALISLLVIGYIAYRNNALPFRLPGIFVPIEDRQENGAQQQDDMVTITGRGAEIEALLSEIPDLPQTQQQQLTAIYENERAIEALLEQASEEFSERDLFASLSAQQTLHVTVLEGAFVKYGVTTASESAEIDTLRNASEACSEILQQERQVLEQYKQIASTLKDDDLRAIFDARIRQSELGRVLQLEACTD